MSQYVWYFGKRNEIKILSAVDSAMLMMTINIEMSFLYGDKKIEPLTVCLGAL